MYKQLKAFLRGIITFRQPYVCTGWQTFDELAAYDLGRTGTLRLFRKGAK